jgi:hypothetical protein
LLDARISDRRCDIILVDVTNRPRLIIIVLGAQGGGSENYCGWLAIFELDYDLACGDPRFKFQRSEVGDFRALAISNNQNRPELVTSLVKAPKVSFAAKSIAP